MRNLDGLKLGHGWNKGKPNTWTLRPEKVHVLCVNCKKDFLVKEYRKDVAKFCCHKCFSDYRKTNGLFKGDNHPNANKRMKWMMGTENPNWSGGKSKRYKEGYNSFEYRQWRKSVFTRDDFQCVLCGANGNHSYITAHHIKSWAKHPELRFDINNGITLCEPCHSKTDNYKGRGKKIVISSYLKEVSK